MTIARRAGAFAAALALCGVPVLWAAEQASATRPSARDTRPATRSQSSGGSSNSASARQSRPTARDTRPTPPPSSGGGGGGSHHHGGGHHFHGHHGHSFWWPSWRSWFYFDFWGPYYYGPAWGYEGPRSADVGALDFDVAPGRTEVYVDGQYLGKVDAYDGFPQYLWIDKGTYDVVLYLEGFKTIARQITVYPGTVLQIDDRMEPGESVRPEDLATKTHERRDARLRNEREMQERARARERNHDRDRDREDSDWRDRVPERSRRPDARDDEDAEEDDARDVRGRPGRLRLEIEPEDASVYLDGRFVGTGMELSRLHAGLLVDPGSHEVSIVRPGYEPEEREFEVVAGGETELDIELEPD